MNIDIVSFCLALPIVGTFVLVIKAWWNIHYEIQGMFEMYRTNPECAYVNKDGLICDRYGRVCAWVEGYRSGHGQHWGEGHHTADLRDVLPFRVSEGIRRRISLFYGQKL